MEIDFPTLPEKDHTYMIAQPSNNNQADPDELSEEQNPNLEYNQDMNSIEKPKYTESSSP